MERKFNNYAEYNQKQTQMYEKFTNHFIAVKKHVMIKMKHVGSNNVASLDVNNC